MAFVAATVGMPIKLALSVAAFHKAPALVLQKSAYVVPAPVVTESCEGHACAGWEYIIWTMCDGVLLRQTPTNFGAADCFAAEGTIGIKLHAHIHLQFIQLYTKPASLSSPSSDCGKT
ncbi:hypothetical protein BDR03DRAFT_984935 [Suillus americanus]|nr:hypothetical protein BDR03DRAFT_984935 [Suillus americanus]